MNIITDITTVTTIAQGFKNGYQSCLEDIGEKINKKKPKNKTIDYQLYGFKGGYKKCLRDRGILPRSISQREAYRRFGKAIIDKWRRDGLVHPTKLNDSENGKIYYDLEELEILYDSTVV
jgi:hypothetical protein